MKLEPPRQHIPFKGGPYRINMGLNVLDPNDWIELDGNYIGEIAQKRALLASRFDSVFVSLPGSEASSQELLELLVAHLAKRFPECFRWKDTIFVNELTGENWDLKSLTHHPLDVAARLVQEDLCLMQARGPVYCLTAGSVCFPSRWKLSDKAGMPMRDIHAPVPFYDKIAMASDQFLSRMDSETPVWRMNWTLHDSPELFQPSAAPHSHEDTPITQENAGQKVWVRLERQTLRRLPVTRDIVFTIRTHIRPLSEYAAPALARELASAIQHLPPETSDYKGAGSFVNAALKYLEERVATELP